MRRHEHLGPLVLGGVSRAISSVLLIDTVMRLPWLLRGAGTRMGLTLVVVAVSLTCDIQIFPHLRAVCLLPPATIADARSRGELLVLFERR